MIHEIHARFQLISHRVDLFFLDRAPNQVTRRVGLPLVFRVMPENVECAPTCSLQPDAAQFLIDELWRLGLRPSEGAGSAGAMAATQKHLEDMRKLVFKA